MTRRYASAPCAPRPRVPPGAAQNGSHVVAPICCLLLSVHLQPPDWEAAYLMPLGVAVQNIVGPSSPSKAVQVHSFTTLVFVCEVKQYLQASTLSAKGPRDMLVSMEVSTSAVLLTLRSAAAGATSRARRTREARAMARIWLGWRGLGAARAMRLDHQPH